MKKTTIIIYWPQGNGKDAKVNQITKGKKVLLLTTTDLQQLLQSNHYPSTLIHYILVHDACFPAHASLIKSLLSKKRSIEKIVAATKNKAEKFRIAQIIICTQQGPEHLPCNFKNENFEIIDTRMASQIFNLYTQP